jgi:hypothetical protein
MKIITVTLQTAFTTRIMKKLIFAVVVVLLTLGWSLQGAAQTVQYVTVTATSVFTNNGYVVSTSYLPVQTSQIVSLAGIAGNAAVSGNCQNGTTFAWPSSGNFTGLTNIAVSSGAGGYPAVATFQITTPASAIVVSNYVPADAIVIPASATGSVQIILESSPDLVNWTAANPGIYGASAGTNRFFRVRAVAN